MNVATGGFGTEITAQTDEGLKDKLGGAAYLLTGKLLLMQLLSVSSAPRRQTEGQIEA